MPKGDQKNNMTEVELLEKKIRKLEERQKKLEEKIEQLELLLTYKTEDDENDNKLQFFVTNLLHEIGIPANLRGYHYIRTAIMWGINDVRSIQLVTKDLYPNIAKKYGTTPGRVERAIRHAIGVALSRGNGEKIRRIFRYTISKEKGQPTNSEFISMIVDYVRLQKGTV